MEKMNISYYLEMSILMLVMALVGGFLIYSVFKWGYEKERAGKRRDIFGRPNNVDSRSAGDMD